MTDCLPPLLMSSDANDHLTDLLSKSCVGGSCSPEKLMSSLLDSLCTPPSLTTLRLNSLMAEHERETGLLKLQKSIEEQYMKRGVAAPAIRTHPLFTDTVLISIIGPQVVTPDKGKEVVVGLQCGMAVLRGADVFAPGVVGSPKHLNIGDIVSVYTDVEGQCKRGLAVSFTGRKLFVGEGIAMQSRHEIFGKSAKNGGLAVQMTKPLYIAPSLSNHFTDMIFPQNFPSIVTSYVLSPRPGEWVLDMCAAPGGKTTHTAMLMKDKGCVVALDKTHPKVDKLEQNVKRFGLTSVQCYACDSTKAFDSSLSPTSEQGPGPPPYAGGVFHRVLLDAPCSALGKRPQAACLLSLRELCSYSQYQKRLFSQAVALLKPGGVLVYSTCTYSPEENECLVHWALQAYPELALATQEPYHVGYPGLPGYGLSAAETMMVQRFGPPLFFETLGMSSRQDEQSLDHMTLDTVGFFIAKFVKK